MSRERRLCAATSLECETGRHPKCAARTFSASEAILRVCPCECHDQGEKRARRAPRLTDVPRPAADVISAWASGMGRLGGRKGGPARARALSPQRRSQIALKAARARWSTR